MAKVKEGPWTYHIIDKFDMSKPTKFSKSLFDSVYALWREETCIHSSTHIAMEHPLYSWMKEEAIKNDKVIGWIIDKIEKEPCMFTAVLLADITGCQPIPKKHSGYTKAVCQDWIAWYDDIYARKRFK